MSANKTAVVYGEQMQQLIECQAALLKVKRSIELRSGRAVSDDGTRCFADVLGYLRALQNEFATNFKRVSDSQDTWTEVCDRGQLPVLCDLTACSERFTRMLVEPLNKVAAKLLEHGVPERDRVSGDEATDVSVIDREFDRQVEKIAENIQSEVARDSRHVVASKSGSVNDNSAGGEP